MAMAKDEISNIKPSELGIELDMDDLILSLQYIDKVRT